MAMTPKEKAVEKVARKIRAKLNVSRNETISKMENLYSQQGKLNDARSTLKKSIQKLTDEKKSLTSSIETLEGRIKELELWLHEEEANKEDIPVDQAIIPIDTWSRQLFDAVAEDHALEDIMYVLDQAVEEGGLISLDEFLKVGCILYPILTL
jgi:chromosome segregation ATPase